MCPIGFDILKYVLLIWKCGSELVLIPESIATVEEGRSLTLTCQSNETSGIYSFFYIDDNGNKIIFGNGGGSFLSCMNSTSQAFMACEFGSHWTFRLTITHPVHNRTVYCSGMNSRQEWLTSTTIFVEGDATLSVKPSSNVVVNQTITLQCLFRSGQLGVRFNFPRGISCAVAFDSSCARGCRNSLSSGCPNNQTYILNVTVLPSWHITTLSCEPPFGGIKSKVTLNVTVPVSTVSISANQTAVSSGTTMYLACETDYCNPPTTVSWYKNNIEISGHTHVTIDSNEYFLSRTISKLQYTVMPRDNRQQMYCIASNIKGERVVSHKITLDVRYISYVHIIPSGNLQLVAGTNQTLIHCYADANPEVIEYNWFKGTFPNLTVLSHSQTLVFKTVDIQDSGHYTCRATNVAGTLTSSIQVIVQYAPLAAKIIEVVCQDTRAFILWTSSNTYSSDDTYKEILQYKRSNDLLFEALEKRNWNRTNNNIKLIEVTDLKPNTEYLFSVLTLTRLGEAFSNNETCITVTEAIEKIIGDCNTQIAVAIGGLLCAFVFIGVLVVTGAIFYKKAKQRKQTVAAGSHKITETYEDQFCESKDHHYDGILPTSTTADNIEMYSNVK